ncbi:LPXTG cell wall anchor domain-containing protein [Streptomyces sp. 2A115]|uniref:LPXTG cell wall anchor domain-containing protein n=1 Tax=Streptomyces sp. 2A115 TaxID=3457439 RepID=UPI003FD3C093
MPTLTRALATRALATRALVVGALATAALSAVPAAHATPPGDNGTVKIHDAATGEELRKNEPHVCAFYLDAFGFDGDQQVDWHIESRAPTAGVKGETVKSGALTLDAEGHGRTNDLSLPDGHYKLFWNFDGEKGAAKHKVFWTDCEGSGGSDESEGSEGFEEGGGTPSAVPASPSDTDGESEAEPSSSASDGAAGPSAQGSGGVDLAETGSGAPVGILTAAAAALLGAGGYLVFRRRKANQD